MTITALDERSARIVAIEGVHRQVFERLVQCYEAEFSAITGKVPNAEGLFDLDTQIDDEHLGYLLYLDQAPAGFSIIASKGECRFEVCEFYVVPAFRSRRLGYLLAADGFDRHRGEWEVKQIAGADKATRFWRNTVGRYTKDSYREDIYQDRYWGTVTRQTFTSNAPAPASSP